MKLVLLVISLFALVLIVSTGVSDAYLTDDNPAPASQASDPVPGGLEVRPASDGEPVPLDFNLQGSSPDEQKATGDLQTPQSGDKLQPNAKTDLFKDDS